MILLGSTPPHSAIDELGFDARFIRMWDYYLAYCEGAFLERHIGDFQLLLTRNHSPRKLFGEPWGGEGGGIEPISHLAARAVDSTATR